MTNWDAEITATIRRGDAAALVQAIGYGNNVSEEAQHGAEALKRVLNHATYEPVEEGEEASAFEDIETVEQLREALQGLRDDLPLREPVRAQVREAGSAGSYLVIVASQPVEEGGGEGQIARFRAKQTDCGVCGIPDTIMVPVCDGYAVPRCNDHLGSPPYQAESRLEAILAHPQHSTEEGERPHV